MEGLSASRVETSGRQEEATCKKKPQPGSFVHPMNEHLPIPLPTLFLVLILIVPHENFGTFEIAHELQTIQGIGIVLDAVVQHGRIAIKIFLMEMASAAKMMVFPLPSLTFIA